MVSIFRRRDDRVVTPRLRSRSDAKLEENINRVALRELTPELGLFLSRAAYVQLALFEMASRAMSTAPDAAGKNALSGVATRSLAKYEGLVAEMRRAGEDPERTMQRSAREIDAFRRDTEGADWFEQLVSSYVIGGFLDDFFVRLAAGLADADAGRRVASLLATPSGDEATIAQLQQAMQADPPLASRLALWGRRLVGDTMLVARESLAVPEVSAHDDARLEPVFTELIAAHTRRMDALGLTA